MQIDQRIKKNRHQRSIHIVDFSYSLKLCYGNRLAAPDAEQLLLAKKKKERAAGGRIIIIIILKTIIIRKEKNYHRRIRPKIETGSVEPRTISVR
jgi:hypothetical protein